MRVIWKSMTCRNKWKKNLKSKTKMNFYEERDEFIQVKEIAEEMKKKARNSEEEVQRKVESEREEEIELEDSVCESDWENSEYENECEHGESLVKIVDG